MTHKVCKLIDLVVQGQASRVEDLASLSLPNDAQPLVQDLIIERRVLADELSICRDGIGQAKKGVGGKGLVGQYGAGFAQA